MKQLSILLAALLICQSAFGLNFSKWNTKLKALLTNIKMDIKDKAGLEDLYTQTDELDKYIAEIDEPSELHLVYNRLMPILTNAEADYKSLTKEEKLVAKETIQYEFAKFKENLNTQINELSVLGKAINYTKAHPYKVTIGTASAIAAILTYKNKTNLMGYAKTTGSYIANLKIAKWASHLLAKFKKPAELPNIDLLEELALQAENIAKPTKISRFNNALEKTAYQTGKFVKALALYPTEQAIKATSPTVETVTSVTAFDPIKQLINYYE